jgi:hypothetical protein
VSRIENEVTEIFHWAFSLQNTSVGHRQEPATVAYISKISCHKPFGFFKPTNNTEVRMTAALVLLS